MIYQLPDTLTKHLLGDSVVGSGIYYTREDGANLLLDIDVEPWRFGEFAVYQRDDTNPGGWRRITVGNVYLGKPVSDAELDNNPDIRPILLASKVAHEFMANRFRLMYPIWDKNKSL